MVCVNHMKTSDHPHLDLNSLDGDIKLIYFKTNS